ncbi:hypothetical protein BC829DRAFT_420533 [Chytridium lagenaria]|nr:hypothetical protein BC829DRAFT_420533 [Chytridium lagenaria]
MSSPTHHVPQKLPSQPPPVMQMPNVGENLASQQDVGQPPLQQGGLVGLPGGGVPMDLYGVSRGYYGFDTAAVPIMPPRTWMLEKQKEQDMLMAQQKQQQDSATKPETSLPTPANALSNPLSPASAIPSRLPSTPVPSPTRITISRKALQAVTPLGDIRADSPSGPPPPVTDDDIEETDLVSDAIRTTVRRHYKTVRRASSVAVHNSLARRNTASSVESSMSSGSGGGGSLLARIGTDLRRNSSIPILYKIQGAPGEILRRRITERREMGGMRPEMEQLQEEEEEREWATNILDQCLPLEHQEFVQVEGGGDNEKTIEELVFLDEDEEEGNSVVSHQQQEMVQRVSDMSTVPAAVRYSMHTSDITERGRGVIVNLHRRFVKLAGGGSYTLSPISKLAAGAASIAIAIASIDGPSNDLPNAPSTNLASQPPNPKFVENDIAAPAVAWLAAPDSDDDDEEAVQEIISQNLPPPPRPAINVPRDILHPYEPCPCVVEPHRAFASPFLAFVAKGPDGGGIGTGCCSALVCVGCLDLAVERGGGIGGFRGGGSGGSSGSSGNMDPVDNAMCPVCGRGLKVR